MSETLHDLQAAALAFRDERDWAKFHRPKDLALGLTIEAGELAELFLWKKETEIADGLDGDAEYREHVADELADVQVFLLYLADASGVDLAEAVRRKLAKNAQKYPVGKARGSAKKYTEI